jgi:hypothetical protein
MRRFKDKDHGPQSTPAVIPRSSTDQNASGEISTFQPGGATIAANNAFFQDLGNAGTAELSPNLGDERGQAAAV